ncbi:MAG: sodium:calcium antiporter, partial [Nanoarchaeota archaeon]
YLLFLLGFFFLIKGASLLINGALSISKKYNLSYLLIGIIILAVGTSLPELIININASIINESSIVSGNIAGSNIANTMLVLGIGALISKTIFSKKTFKFDLSYALISTYAVLALLFLQFLLVGELVIIRFHGLILISMLIIYLVYIFKRKNEFKKEIIRTIKHEQLSNMKIAFLQIIVGSVALHLGGEWVVSGAISISQSVGVTTSFISSSIIALGTSLPELTTTIFSLLKKKEDLAIGNIIGSNILNILLVFGVSAVITPIVFNQTSIFNFLFAAFTILLVILALSLRKINQGEYALMNYHGFLFVLVYVVYILLTYLI